MSPISQEVGLFRVSNSVLYRNTIAPISSYRYMTILSLLLGSTLLPVAVQSPLPPITVGWSDEMNIRNSWRHLEIDHKPTMTFPKHGAMRLELSKVPSDWPYTYQWSGVRQRAVVDIVHFPFLTSSVTDLQGYAHMDIDVLDAAGKKVKGFRSSTLQSDGVSFVDLAGQLDPAAYTMEIRLIIGGPNEGCRGTYNWVRFTSPEDGQRLQQAPNTKNLRHQRGSRLTSLPRRP